MKNMKIKKGDQVRILTGKDRGKSGKVLRTVKDSGKVVVEGLNIVKKHRRPKRGGEKGQRVEIPAPVSVSNIGLICNSCGKVTRVGYKVNDKNKIRVCKKCNSET